jgi:3-phosphoglycerate kinase
VFQQVMESYIGIQTEREMKVLEEIKQKLMSGKRTAIIFGGRKWEKLEHIYEIAANKNVKVLCGGIPGESVCYMLDKDSLNSENQEIVRKIGSLDIVSKLVSEFKERISYPSDFVLDTKENVSVAELRNKKGVIMDIGDATIEKFFREIADSEMILYAGPVGRYEKGYHQSARLLNRIMSIKVPNYTLGGSSAESIDDYGVEKMYDTIKGVRITSGGAALAFLAGTDLPVLKAFSGIQ